VRNAQRGLDGTRLPPVSHGKCDRLRQNRVPLAYKEGGWTRSADEPCLDGNWSLSGGFLRGSVCPESLVEFLPTSAVHCTVLDGTRVLRRQRPSKAVSCFSVNMKLGSVPYVQSHLYKDRISIASSTRLYHLTGSSSLYHIALL
jgi:hypothetical protein